MQFFSGSDSVGFHIIQPLCTFVLFLLMCNLICYKERVVAHHSDTSHLWLITAGAALCANDDVCADSCNPEAMQTCMKKPPRCSTTSAPAAIAADKLGGLIASQKLLAAPGISGPVGARWRGLSHTEPPHAIGPLLMHCGIFHGASRLPGWRQIVRTSVSAAWLWLYSGLGAPNERLVGSIKVKTPWGLSHIYSTTLSELITQVKPAASVLAVRNALMPFYCNATTHTAHCPSVHVARRAVKCICSHIDGNSSHNFVAHWAAVTSSAHYVDIAL